MVNKLNKQHACQLEIEQELTTLLETDDLTPGKIQELIADLKKRYDSDIKADSLRRRANRQKKAVTKKAESAPEKLTDSEKKIVKHVNGNGKRKTRSDKVDSIVLTDKLVLKVIRQLAYDSGQPINTLILLGLDEYRHRYL